jgi:hypothetical protein
MKSISVLTAFIVLFATSALADNCTPGLHYCGSTLLQVGPYYCVSSSSFLLLTTLSSAFTLLSLHSSLTPKIGKYQAQIDQALSDAGVPKTNGGKADLFDCIGGDNGMIKYLKSCAGCINGGQGNSDFCAT